jgi:hypothetical protein
VRRFLHYSLALKIAFVAAGITILSTVAVQPAHSQFGIDLAAILTGLKEINGTLNSAVASPLRLINQVEQQERQFQQQVLSADGDRVF